MHRARARDARNPGEVLDGRLVGQKQAGEGLEFPPADYAVRSLEQGTQAHQRLQLFVDAVLQQQRKVVGTLAQLQLGQLVLAMPDDGPGRDRQRKAHERGRNAGLDIGTPPLSGHAVLRLSAPTKDPPNGAKHGNAEHADCPYANLPNPVARRFCADRPQSDRLQRDAL